MALSRARHDGGSGLRTLAPGHLLQVLNRVRDGRRVGDPSSLIGFRSEMREVNFAFKRHAEIGRRVDQCEDGRQSSDERAKTVQNSRRRHLFVGRLQARADRILTAPGSARPGPKRAPREASEMRRQLMTTAIAAACFVLGAGGATLYTHADTGRQSLTSLRTTSPTRPRTRRHCRT